MVTDRDIAKQMLERDVINIYRQLPQLTNMLGINIAPMLSLLEDKFMTYADAGIEVLLSWLFGADASGDVDEAAEIAKMVTNDKIEEYRRKIRAAKAEAEKTEIIQSNNNT